MERAPVARTFISHGLPSRILTHMYEHADNPYLSDTQVHAGGKTFPCHRAVLSASSPVFAAMFQSDMLEQQSGHLTLDTIPADVFATLRDFMYGRPLQVHDNHALSLSAFVRSYEIGLPELPDFLDILLTSALTLDSVHAVREHADAHAAHRLRRNCDRFITTRMKLLPQSDPFLSASHVAAIAALRAPANVSREIAGRKCAQYVFVAAVAWLRYDDPAREQYRDDVLATVDVEGLSLPALVRASRDSVALRSDPFQARLLRAFATTAERDLNFGSLTSQHPTQLQPSHSRGFALVDNPHALHYRHPADDINLFPHSASRALYYLRTRSALNRPRMISRTQEQPSNVIHPPAESSTSDSEDVEP